MNTYEKRLMEKIYTAGEDATPSDGLLEKELFTGEPFLFIRVDPSTELVGRKSQKMSIRQTKFTSNGSDTVRHSDL